jgi:copper chaperone CopZ
MKILVPIFTLILSLSLACNRSAESKQATDQIDSTAFKLVTLRVDGMTCEGCESTIKKSVEKLTGIANVQASYRDSTTRVVFDTTKVTLLLISEKIAEVGYTIVNENSGQVNDSIR